MSTPVSTKLAPLGFVDPRVRRRYLHIYIIQIWISLLPASFLLYWFYFPGNDSFLMLNLWNAPWWATFLLTPFYLTIVYIITVIWTATVTKMRIGTLKILCKPREGIFQRDPSDKDYRAWNKRNLSRIFLNWLLYSTPFTFLKPIFAFKFLSVKIGKNSTINHTWITPEFVTIGNNVKLGPGTSVYSFLIEDDKFLVANVVIHDNVYTGPHCVIQPGTVINENVTIDGVSSTDPFQQLEKGGMYKGIPAKLQSQKNPI